MTYHIWLRNHLPLKLIYLTCFLYSSIQITFKHHQKQLRNFFSLNFFSYTLNPYIALFGITASSNSVQIAIFKKKKSHFWVYLSSFLVKKGTVTDKVLSPFFKYPSINGLCFCSPGCSEPQQNHCIQELSLRNQGINRYFKFLFLIYFTNLNRAEVCQSLPCHLFFCSYIPKLWFLPYLVATRHVQTHSKDHSE